MLFLALSPACGEKHSLGELTDSTGDPSGSTGDSPGSTGDSPGSTGDPTDSTSGSDTTGDEPTSGTGGDDWTRICDGSGELRLAMVLGGGGMVENELERALGFRYLYVLGTCEYHVLAQFEDVRWPDARTGVMDESVEEALSRAIDYGGLAEIAGDWSGGADDGTTLIVSDGVSSVWCQSDCPGAPPQAQALGPISHAWTRDLWEHGEPVFGALRVSVVVVPGAAPGMPTAPWPLTIDPSSIAAGEEAGSEYPTVRIDGGDDLPILRELRRQYREDDLPPGTPNNLYDHGHLLFHDAGGQDLFKLWIRDSLPLEDENGRIPLPPP